MSSTSAKPARAVWAGVALTLAGLLSTARGSVPSLGGISDTLRYGLTTDSDLMSFFTASAILLIGGIVTLLVSVVWAASKDNPGPLPRIAAIVGAVTGIYFVVVAIGLDRHYGGGSAQIGAVVFAVVGAGSSLSMLRSTKSSSGNAKESAEDLSKEFGQISD
jgi:hypothetical protein